MMTAIWIVTAIGSVYMIGVGCYFLSEAKKCRKTNEILEQQIKILEKYDDRIN